MPIHPFLAMTAADMQRNITLPQRTAWLGCQFSSWNPGLSNLPDTLPPESLLILTDQTPFDGHDPSLILRQLERCIETFSCCALLLDLQRPGNAEVVALANLLTTALPCPVVVSACYGQDLRCPIFLPPAPPSVPLQDWLSSWKNRETWLELAMDGEIITLTEQGAEVTPLPFGSEGEGFADERLNCHYRIETTEDSAQFTLWRTREDLEDLISDAESLGVAETIGLYQELQQS